MKKKQERSVNMKPGCILSKNKELVPRSGRSEDKKREECGVKPGKSGKKIPWRKVSKKPGSSVNKNQKVGTVTSKTAEE